MKRQRKTTVSNWGMMQDTQGLPGQWWLSQGASAPKRFEPTPKPNRAKHRTNAELEKLVANLERRIKLVLTETTSYNHYPHGMEGCEDGTGMYFDKESVVELLDFKPVDTYKAHLHDSI